MADSAKLGQTESAEQRGRQAVGLLEVDAVHHALPTLVIGGLSLRAVHLRVWRSHAPPAYSSADIRSMPDGLGDADDHFQFSPFIGLGDRITRNSRGKTALRADRKPVEIDILRCLGHPSLENRRLLQNRVLAANDAQHDALILYQPQGFEIAGR